MQNQTATTHEQELDQLKPADRVQYDSQVRVYGALNTSAQGSTHAAMGRAVAAYLVDQAFITAQREGTNPTETAIELLSNIVNEAEDYCKFRLARQAKR